MPPKVDLRHFLTTSRVLVVAGKGGVGKTTVSAVIARCAARRGMTVRLVELDGRSRLDELVDAGAVGDRDASLPGTIVVDHLTPAHALAEYLDDHGLRAVSRRLVSSGIVDIVSTAAPGIDDLLVLGKIKQLERAAGPDELIVVDGPAAGHAITFLQAARALADAVRSGPIAQQARDVLSLLADPARCQVVLVTVPETTPVNELLETADALEDRVGVQLAPIIVNGVDLGDALAPLPRSGVPTALRRASAFRTRRRAAQATAIFELAAAIALDRLDLPAVSSPGLTAADIDRLAVHLARQIDGAP